MPNLLQHPHPRRLRRQAEGRERLPAEVEEAKGGDGRRGEGMGGDGRGKGGPTTTGTRCVERSSPGERTLTPSWRLRLL